MDAENADVDVCGRGFGVDTGERHDDDGAFWMLTTAGGGVGGGFEVRRRCLEVRETPTCSTC